MTHTIGMWRGYGTRWGGPRLVQKSLLRSVTNGIVIWQRRIHAMRGCSCGERCIPIWLEKAKVLGPEEASACASKDWNGSW